MSKYLSMGESEYVYLVRGGYAINVAYDGTIIMFEATTSRDGYYDQDDNAVSAEVEGLYKHILAKEANGYPGFTIDSILTAFISSFKQQDFGLITGAPKLTKMLAQGLDKIDEVMTFETKPDDTLDFVCFGTRKAVTDILDERESTSIHISPMLYYYATQFRGSPYHLVADNLLIIANEEKTSCAVVMGIDIAKRTVYRENKHIMDDA